MAVSLGLVDDDGVQQALAADGSDQGAVEFAQTIAEDLAELFGPFDHLLLVDDLECADGNGAAERVAAVRGPVGTRFDGQHNLLPAQNAGHRVHAAGDSLAKEHEVGLDAGPFVAEEFACASDAGLDFVADEEDVVLVAEGSEVGEIAVGGDDYTGFSLDRLNQETGDFVSMGLEDAANGRDVVVRDHLAGSWVQASNTW